MKKSGSNYTAVRFHGNCVPLIIFSVFVLLFVVVAAMGIKLPLDAQSFEATTLIKVLSVVAGVLGILAGFIGLRAANEKSDGKLRLCGVMGLIIIVIMCTLMILSDGYTNPHVWLLLGTIAIIPSYFTGNALRLIRFGWDD
ncbi:MAG: hypothetical protein Q4C25_00090 [Bacillota bacterium]|nr:hypothetical protein [Bacillota bacterium]